MRLDLTTRRRLWAKIDTTGGRDACWPWTGALSSKLAYPGGGYGQLSINGRPRRATHLVWNLVHPDDPVNGRHILHSCDNPPCCNPRHLHPGDNYLNQQERVARGRHYNANKTHCPQGHPYEGDNLYVQPKGSRMCRTCTAAGKRRRYEERQRAQ